GFGYLVAKYIAWVYTYWVQARPHPHKPEHPAYAGYFYFSQYTIKCFLNTIKTILHSPVEISTIRFGAAFSFKSAQRRGSQIHKSQNIGIAAGNFFFHFEGSAIRGKRQISKESKGSRRPGQFSEITRRRPAHRRTRQVSS